MTHTILDPTARMSLRRYQIGVGKGDNSGMVGVMVEELTRNCQTKNFP